MNGAGDASRGRFKVERYATDEEMCRALERGEAEMGAVKEALMSGTKRTGVYWDLFRLVPAGDGWRAIFHRVDVEAAPERAPLPSILVPGGGS